MTCRARLLAVSLPLLALATAAPMAAQQALPLDSTVVHELVLTDGSTLFVHVLEESEAALRVRLVSGDELRVERGRIRSLRAARGTVREGRFMRTDPNPTRLLFAPTARALPRGRGYVALYEVVMPFVTVAASDRFLLSGGTPYVPGAIGKVWWFAPKLNVLSRGDTDLALGTLAFAFEDETAGILYLVGTKGSPDRAVSGALGYGFADGALADTPALMLGLEQRVSESVKLISESYYFDGEGLLGFGVRFFGTRLSADVGIGFATAAVDSWAPLVNFAYSW